MIKDLPVFGPELRMQHRPKAARERQTGQQGGESALRCAPIKPGYI